MSLILASGSRYRQALLQLLKIPFQVVHPTVDEDALKIQLSHLAPVDLCQQLALAKARSVAELHPEDVVIGSDQLVSLQGSILGKPGTAARAIDQLGSMQGQWHELITCTQILSPQGAHSDCNLTRMHMRPLSHEQITRYVDHDQPLDCAGAYRFESLGIALFAKVEMIDPTAIQGLPLLFVSQTLGKLGYSIP